MSNTFQEGKTSHTHRPPFYSHTTCAKLCANPPKWIFDFFFIQLKRANLKCWTIKNYATKMLQFFFSSNLMNLVLIIICCTFDSVVFPTFKLILNCSIGMSTEFSRETLIEAFVRFLNGRIIFCSLDYSTKMLAIWNAFNCADWKNKQVQ